MGVCPAAKQTGLIVIHPQPENHTFSPFLSPENRLLLLCSRTVVDVDSCREIQKLLETETINWQAFLIEASIQNVAGLAYHGLTTIHPTLAAYVPKDTLLVLRNYARDLSAQTLQLAFTLHQIIRMFEQADIQALPYKGPTLAALAYPNLSLRMTSDLDILVHQRDIVKAKDLLLGEGYLPVASEEHRHLQHNNPGRSYQGYDLIHQVSQVTVDLQERAGIRFASFAMDLGALWERRTTVKLAGIPFATLSPEDYLLTLCAHGTQHRWQKLKWACDIAELMRSHSGWDWDYVTAQIARFHNARMVNIGLVLAQEYLDAPLPPAIAGPLEADVTARRLADESIRWMFRRTEDLSQLVDRYAFDLDFDLKTRERLADKIRCGLFVLRRRVTPNDSDRQLVRLPIALSFLYYVIRPLRILIAYGGYSLRSRRRSGFAG